MNKNNTIRLAVLITSLLIMAVCWIASVITGISYTMFLLHFLLLGNVWGTAAQLIKEGKF